MAQQQQSGAVLNDLHDFQRDILTVIAGLDDPEPKGLAVKAAIEEAYGVDEVNHGRIYPNLTQLAEKGLIEKGEIDRRTNSYSLTERARRELRADLEWRIDCVDLDDR